MKTSEKGVQLITTHEGLKLNAYVCPAGVWTIGYGHTRTAKQGMTITKQRAEELLKDDLQTAENAVNNQLLRLSQNQFDALVSFVFNVGPGNFRKSTLLSMIKLNANNPLIADEFMRWHKGGGRVLPGLVKRREDEANLYFGRA
ncbi:lysozyme [Alkaliflexus imshenetskii]|uniref:lysozyme n=1 Tax=Alkaliflexus imshenetskii TaxID=286730 RepID=UPI0004794AF6|nr:lysozyme [Alkaliflexus imshenetskii]